MRDLRQRAGPAAQGPPGSGKTYTVSRMIARFLAGGLRVGITSNSHKAINHLLAEVMKVVKQQGIHLHAVKKFTAGNPATEFDYPVGGVDNVANNDDVWASAAQLVAGTAWLFADARADQQFDVLFVDEAGQVALANLIAAGTAARNIVLLGDQMQLSQPVQGVHPGRSGDSALDYLLDGASTIAPDRGIFPGYRDRQSGADGDQMPNAGADGAGRYLVLDSGVFPRLDRKGL